MKEQFVDWKPNQLSRQRLAVIGATLARFEKLGVTLTLRQLFYLLVDAKMFDSNKKGFQYLDELCTKARLSGLMAWDSLEDTVHKPWAGRVKIKASAESIG